MMINTRDYYLEAAHLPEYLESENMAKEAVKTVLGIGIGIGIVMSNE